MADQNAAVTCTIDGEQIKAAEAVFAMNSPDTYLGVAKMGVPIVSVHVRIDLNDKQACPFSTIKKLFELSNPPTSDNVKQVKVEFWKDIKNRDVICSYSFQGWISSFRTSYLGRDTSNSGYNHVLDLVLTPDTTSSSYKEVRIGN